jgi:selenocysteine lyase/cysteine desulfurase
MAGSPLHRRCEQELGRKQLPIDLGSQRHLFEVPEDVAYFNTTNMSPLLRAVREAGESGVARRMAPWLAAADWFGDVERLRRDYAGILCTGCGVALIRATSYGLAVAARNVPVPVTPGDQIVVLADEYPANYYTWRRFCLRTGSELVVAQRERGAT